MLEHEGRRTHGYRSVYLDTPDLASYRVAGQRRRRRWKVRSRSYLDTGGSWLEVKTRSARDVTTKVRIPHADLESVLDGRSRSSLRRRSSLAAARSTGVRARELRPVLATSYDRSTLLLPGDRPTRVTIDTELGWTWLAGRRLARPDRPGLAIVETKGGSTPSAMDRLLWARGHRPVSISKYGVGVAALHDVPRLKWHRVLARDLGVSRLDDDVADLPAGVDDLVGADDVGELEDVRVDHGQLAARDQLEQRREVSARSGDGPALTLPRARSVSPRSATTSSRTPSVGQQSPAAVDARGCPTLSRTTSNFSVSRGDRRQGVVDDVVGAELLEEGGVARHSRRP